MSDQSEQAEQMKVFDTIYLIMIITGNEHLHERPKHPLYATTANDYGRFPANETTKSAIQRPKMQTFSKVKIIQTQFSYTYDLRHSKEGCTQTRA